MPEREDADDIYIPRNLGLTEWHPSAKIYYVSPESSGNKSPLRLKEFFCTLVHVRTRDTVSG